MLTLADCIALSELREDEIEAIAEDAHLPEIIAAEIGCYLQRGRPRLNQGHHSRRHRGRTRAG